MREQAHPAVETNMSEHQIDPAERNATVAVYSSHEGADSAIKTLQRSGVDMKKLSILGRGFHPEEQVVGYFNTSDRMQHWGKAGAFWGGLWGFMFGGFFLIPGFGPLVAAGWFVSSLVGLLGGAAVGGGFGLVAGVLSGVGIPQNSMINYERALKADKFVLVLHGTHAEVDRARQILGATTPDLLETHYNPPRAAETAA